MADLKSLFATEYFAGQSGPGEAGEPSALPERVGRYRIERVLGKGGFGLVYLAHDE